MRNATQYINDRKKLFEKARDATQWVKLFGIQSKITCYMELTGSPPLSRRTFECSNDMKYCIFIEDASTELKDDSVNSCKIVALSEALYVVKTDAEGQGVVDSEKSTPFFLPAIIFERHSVLFVEYSHEARLGFSWKAVHISGMDEPRGPETVLPSFCTILYHLFLFF